MMVTSQSICVSIDINAAVPTKTVAGSTVKMHVTGATKSRGEQNDHPLIKPKALGFAVHKNVFFISIRITRPPTKTAQSD